MKNYATYEDAVEAIQKERNGICSVFVHPVAEGDRIRDYSRTGPSAYIYGPCSVTTRIWHTDGGIEQTVRRGVDYTNGSLDDDARADAVKQDAYEHGFDREEGW